MATIKWSVADIVKILTTRQDNQFDGNIAVSGDRGNGKSHLICKIFYRLGHFTPNKHQVYSRDDVIRLLSKQKYGKCFDDEAINTGYKRNFQLKGQQELIKILTMYRDNFNIHASAIPNFFSLDKDLRDLYFMHLHVIERGIAIVHMPLQGRLYSQDRWDAKYNAKVEEKWSKRMQKNPSFKPPYHKLSTFRGYLFVRDITDKQTEIYERIKHEKRQAILDSDENSPENQQKSFMQRIYKLLLENKLTKSGLMQSCLVDDKKYSAVTRELNVMLRDSGSKKTSKDYLEIDEKLLLHSKVSDQIDKVIPDF